MENKDITLMICGPLRPCGIDNVPYYLSKSLTVIYSTWKPKNNIEEQLLIKIRTMLSEDKIIISDDIDVSTFDNVQNIYYQIYTWYKGGN